MRGKGEEREGRRRVGSHFAVTGNFTNFAEDKAEITITQQDKMKKITITAIAIAILLSVASCSSDPSLFQDFTRGAQEEQEEQAEGPTITLDLEDTVLEEDVEDVYFEI